VSELTEGDNLSRRRSVQSRSGFIENQDLRLRDDGASDSDSTFLTAGDTARERSSDLVVCDVLQSETLEGIVDVTVETRVGSSESKSTR